MSRTRWCCLAAACLAARAAGADPPTPADDSPAAAPTPEPDLAPPASGEPAPPSPASGELIEVTDTAPPSPGTISLDSRTARDAPGALGEPFRALALLPGVTTSVAASGYPIIRGSLPGESRYAFDGIEIPMLYHLVLGNQVIHPSFVGDLQLRAGAHGADQGQLIGGLVAMTPANLDTERTELRANPVEIGAFRAQHLGDDTAIAYALRVGTLTLPARVYDSSMALYYVDQQTRFVHRFDGDDTVTLTSLGAYDYARLPPDDSGTVVTDQLGFHRLDARWTHGHAGRQVRAGVETQLDALSRDTVYPIPPPDSPFSHTQMPPLHEGGHAYGVRAYTDGELALAPWLTARAGLAARHRTLVHGRSPFELSDIGDPFVGLARDVDAEGAWLTADVRLGAVTVTPGVRADSFHAELFGAAVRHDSVDPRLAITVELPGDARLELAGGGYTAPPQVSIFTSSMVIGPLPMTDGAAASAGMNHSIQGQVALRTPLPGGLRAEFAAYARRTHYAVDFGMHDGTFQVFSDGNPCDPQGSGTAVYRDIDQRALGVEAMVRRDLGRSVTGWLSYSLTKQDRDFGFITLPTEFDQRHTLNAVVQWRRGAWTLGATGHAHTGRPAEYPRLVACSPDPFPQVQGNKSLDDLRRTPLDYRLDLRVERAFHAGGYDVRLYFEIQNATLTREVTGYDYTTDDPRSFSAYHVVPTTVFLPLPLIGIEALR